MKPHLRFAAAVVLCAAVCLTGCGQTDPPTPTSTAPAGPSAPEAQVTASPAAPAGETPASSLSGEAALAIALGNAGVPEEDAYNVKVETDGDHEIPIYDIEFETDYGDYDFEVAMEDGRIVGADYEVDEEWLDLFGGSSVSLEEAKAVVLTKVPGAAAEDIRIWETHGDGRGRYEGELFHAGMKYEFELDPRTGLIFDWNADLRD